MAIRLIELDWDKNYTHKDRNGDLVPTAGTRMKEFGASQDSEAACLAEYFRQHLGLQQQNSWYEASSML